MKKAIENYPFVKILENHVTGKKHENPRIYFTYEICGEKYERWDYDDYIDDAIDLASKWKPKEITFTRISYLRSWLRENVQHTHNIHYNNIRSLEGCKKFIDKVIEAEYRYMEPEENKKTETDLQKEANRLIMSV